MVEILQNYLVLHKSINIPGLGTICLEKVSAKVDPDNKQISPPYYTLRFDKYYDVPGRDFFSYLSSKKNIPDFEAIELYNQFARDFCAEIRSKDRAEIDTIGTFKKDTSGEITFHATEEYRNVYAPVILPEPIRNNESHVETHPEAENVVAEPLPYQGNEIIERRRKKYSWQVYAWVLLTLAMLVLCLHLLQTGFRWGTIANRQQLDVARPVR